MGETGNIVGLSNKYEEEGTYTVSLRVCESSGNINVWGLEDGEGECTVESVEITVENLAPEVEISPASSTVETGETQTLVASVTSGNSPYTYSWSCSNGDTYGDVDSIDFSEETAGTYTCSVTVTDLDGDTDNDTVEVIVVATDEETTTTAQEEDTNDNVALFGTGGGVVAPEPQTGEEEEADTQEEETTEEDEDSEILGAEEESCEVDSKLSGYAYNDKNKNGEREEGEESFKDVEVMIYEGSEIEEDEEPLSIVKTDENGYWEAEVCSGEYTVKINEETAPDKYEVPEARVLGVTDEEANEINFGFVRNRSILRFWWIALIGVVFAAVLGLLAKRKEEEENA
jgi:hypothetical protein